MTADVLGRRPEHPIGEAATLRRFAFPRRRERKLRIRKPLAVTFAPAAGS
jgi:hypothetical protein